MRIRFVFAGFLFFFKEKWVVKVGYFGAGGDISSMGPNFLGGVAGEGGCKFSIKDTLCEV